MRLPMLACAALLATALAALPGATADPLEDLGVRDVDLPSCHASANEEGTTGVGCRLASTCYSIVWGYHSEFLTVGGGSSCSGGAWVNPDEDPTIPPTDVCRGLTSEC